MDIWHYFEDFHSLCLAGMFIFMPIFCCCCCLLYCLCRIALKTHTEIQPALFLLIKITTQNSIQDPVSFLMNFIIVITNSIKNETDILIGTILSL